MTAVEWLRSKMLIECLEPSDELFKQAKEMEKEQIKEAYVSGFDDLTLSAEGYYNKYFTKK